MGPGTKRTASWETQETPDKLYHQSTKTGQMTNQVVQVTVLPRQRHRGSWASCSQTGAPSVSAWLISCAGECCWTVVDVRFPHEERRATSAGG